MENYHHEVKSLAHLAQRYVLGIPTVQQVLEETNTAAALKLVETVEIDVPKGTRAALSVKHYIPMA